MRPREEMLAALKQLDEMLKLKHAVSDGNFVAHIDFSVVVTYMHKVPVEYSMESYISADTVSSLQKAVRDIYEEVSDTEVVFNSLDEECKRMEEGNHGEQREFDSGKEDYEKGLD